MKKILYIIDDINYNSGAKKVTLFQMKELSKEYDIYLLTLVKPKESIDFLEKDHILDKNLWQSTEVYAESFKKVMKSGNYSVLKKIKRIIYTISLRCGCEDFFLKKMFRKQLLPLMESFDDVIVVSEASKLRRLVSELKHPKKIQWIHTDYARWSEYSEWSKAVTRNDAELYRTYDSIVVLSEYCKVGLIKKLPELAEIVVVIPNLIDGSSIKSLSDAKCPVEVNADILNLITVARIDYEKRIDKIFDIAKRMKAQGQNFNWFIVGDGPLRRELEKRCNDENMDGYIKFLGHLENPYTIMKQCDALVLTSKYEGTPVTIDEAMVLGLYIVAPELGGIPEQVKEYKYCTLVNSLEIEGINISDFHVCKAENALVYNIENMKVLNRIREII